MSLRSRHQRDWHMQHAWNANRAGRSTPRSRCPGRAAAAVALALSQLANGAAAQEFTDALELCRGDDTHSVAVADLDGDGRLDLVFGNGRHEARPNLIYINGSTANLLYEPRPLGNDGTYSVEIADLNGDGHPDLAVGNDRGFQNRIYFNDGNGNFALGFAFGRDATTRDLALGDVDGDGDVDILVANRGDANEVYRNEGGGRFSKAGEFGPGDDLTRSVVLADVDLDGHLDVAVANRGGQPNFVYLNDGSARFDRPIPFGTGDDESMQVVAADLNGNGYIDLVTANLEGGGVRVHLNDGALHFDSSVVLAPGENVRAVAVADVDGDGHPDIVAGMEGGIPVQAAFRMDTVPAVFLFLTRSTETRNRVFLNDGNGTFTPGPPVGRPGRSVRELVVADIDGDGRPDIVEANNCSANSVYLQK